MKLYYKEVEFFMKRFCDFVENVKIMNISRCTVLLLHLET